MAALYDFGKKFRQAVEDRGIKAKCESFETAMLELRLEDMQRFIEEITTYN